MQSGIMLGDRIRIKKYCPFFKLSIGGVYVVVNVDSWPHGYVYFYSPLYMDGRLIAAYWSDEVEKICLPAVILDFPAERAQ